MQELGYRNCPNFSGQETSAPRIFDLRLVFSNKCEAAAGNITFELIGKGLITKCKTFHLEFS